MQFFMGGGARRAIIAGVIALASASCSAWPEASVKTVAILVGLAFLIRGIAWVVAALAERGEG